MSYRLKEVSVSNGFVTPPGWRSHVVRSVAIGGLAGGVSCVAMMLRLLGHEADRRLSRTRSSLSPSHLGRAALFWMPVLPSGFIHARAIAHRGSTVPFT